MLFPDCAHEEQLREVAEHLADARYADFLADAGGSAVGLAEAELRTDYVNGTTTRPVAFLEGLYVLPQERRKGVARALVAAVAQWGREQGCTELASDALADDRTSHAMHRALGFQETERVVFFRRSLLELRPARPEDADAVADVLLASRKAFLPYLPSPRSEHEVRRWITTTVLSTQDVTVAVVDSKIVGMLCAQPEKDASWIWQLYLLPAHVRQGIGSRLLAGALARLPRPVRLWCFQRNSGARRFYERHGFVAVKFTDGRDNEERTPDVLYELA